MILNTEIQRHRDFISLIYKSIFSVSLCLCVLFLNYDTPSY